MSLQYFVESKYKTLLKRQIWAYFFLLIFEGALRKWFLPEIATPLLIIRDPLAFWIIYKAWRLGYLSSNIYLLLMLMISIIGTFTAVLLGHGNLSVAIFGARTLVLHFPLMFIIGRIFNRADVLRMGKTVLLISIPMAMLVALQFYSPQSAWVNRGVGGDMEGAGFNGGALGFFRPPGTFSFTTGVTQFYSLAAIFVVYFWFCPNGINRLFLLVATIGLIVVIPLSISRGLFFQLGVTLSFAFVGILRNPEYLGRMILAAIGIMVGIAALNEVPLFQTAIEVFSIRITSASEAEGGLEGTLGDRFFGGIFQSLIQSIYQPFFGYGLGMGTNVGSMLLTGDLAFLISEGEWGRLIGELGPLMGLAVIFIRLNLIIKIALASFKQLAVGDLLPWTLLSFGIFIFPLGQWGVATTLGFCTLVIGLNIACLRKTKHGVDDETE